MSVDHLGNCWSATGSPKYLLIEILIPQTAFTLWCSHSCVIPGGLCHPPGWLYDRSFLLLFTTLLHRTMHFVETRAALGPLFIVKHNAFEHSNGPLALGPQSPLGPRCPQRTQMTLQMTLQITRFTPRILHHEYCTTKFTPQILHHECYTTKFTPHN